MYTNQLMTEDCVHTIKTEFINKFSPLGGCLSLKETVITVRWVMVGGAQMNGEILMCVCVVCK